MGSKKPKSFPEQSQDTPGIESQMTPEPIIITDDYKGSDKFKNKVVLITGGDSGIGRSVAVHFAREGADVAVVYLSEDKDAEETAEMIRKENSKCLLLKGDIGNEDECKEFVQKTVKEFGGLNILVNNAGEQHPKDSLEEIDSETMEKTFRTNIFSMFYLTKEALKHLKEGDSIINTTSITSYRGSEHLIDYSATKGAITAFTRSLGTNLAKKGIRVNAVAPGPIWTPLIVSTFDKVSDFGHDTPIGRAGQPYEVAPAYLFLASDEASYITSQVIHPNGGEVVNT
jgi:NAD(P)-dependent dehydrogenase (short-subunit alcohol dehydrogenase family)